MDAQTALDGQHAADEMTVGVVYGAGHVAGIVYGLRRLGYRPRTGDWTRILPF